MRAGRPGAFPLVPQPTHAPSTPGGPSGRIAPAACAALVAALALGCGHPASRDECETIFRRSAEIELRAQNITEPKLIEARTAAVREARGKELIDKCVGRRITDGALACVREATSPAQVDRCLQ